MRTNHDIASLVILMALRFANCDSLGGIILQDKGDSGVQIAYFSPIGQSFIAEEIQLTAIAFAFWDINPSHPNLPITMSLYEGSGFGGTMIASVAKTLPSSLPGGGSDPRPAQFIDFDFSGNDLVIGSPYTAAVTTSSAKVGLRYNRTDAYVAGQAVESRPTDPPSVSPGYDLDFRVTSVPEPSAALLAIAGVVFLTARVRRCLA